jgi:hypothetical protein
MALEAWLGQCEDGFAIHASTKTDKTPTLDTITKIRLTGTQLLEPTMATWWSSGRKDFLKLPSWESFESKIKERFMPKGYKMLALRSFFLCEQGKFQFLDYAAALAEARNAVGISVISTYVYKCQLLFHSHPILLLCIMAMPEFNMETIGFDDLVSLLSMQWESLIAEGVTGRVSKSSAYSQPLAPVVSVPAITAPRTAPPRLTDAERTRLTDLGGCWKCRKVPTDDGWTDHVGRTCPGDATLGILPGRDFVPVKKEIVGFALTDNNGEDQPDRVYQDDDTDSDC